MSAKERIIVALDVSTREKALELVELLSPYVGYFKLGLEVLTSIGAPTIVQDLQAAGGKIFFDGKFMDIPNTVAGASAAVTKLGVDMFNVHCFGSLEMMKAARNAADEAAQAMGKKAPIILGVTLLTSLNYHDLVLMGIYEDLNIADPRELEEVKRTRIERLVGHQLAWLAQKARLDGVIASPQEIQVIRSYTQPDFLKVTPGVRPVWAATGDQKRVMTPAEAIKAGANYLVIGRPITQPPPEIDGPVEAAKRIAEEIAKVL